MFQEKHNISPEDVAKTCGYSLKTALTNSGSFSVYGISMHENFHVALLRMIHPGQVRNCSVHDKVKRSYQNDGHLIKILKTETATQRQEYLLALPREIKSSDELEFALIEIISHLTSNNPRSLVTIGALSKKFCNYYGRPIRSVIRDVRPDMKLIQLIQLIPSLRMQKINNDWQIAMESSSID